MEELTIVPVKETIDDRTEVVTKFSTDRPFIQANTIDMTLEEISRTHIIPVFAKDNEPLISHSEFIESTMELVSDCFHGERILKPAIRVSHPIMGRIPEAKNKPADQLEDFERTIYYERMAFIIEVPSIYDNIEGNQLSLTIGGVKAYNLDNLHSKKGAEERFKVFIGFKNSVCTNLCIWTDGSMLDIAVKSIEQLNIYIRALIEGYNQNHHLYHLKDLSKYSLTEHQFATLIGRCKLYSHLPVKSRTGIPPMQLGDSQLNLVCKDYFKDDSFCKDDKGDINLWRLYNLFTSANKGTYIDSFLDRGSNSFDFVYNIKSALKEQRFNWFLS